MLIDLRSDTLTKPTSAMRAAMHTAEVGDDAFGEDPTVRLLEERVARILQKEQALFVPSGTMANQIAILLHTRPGDSVIAEEGAHCVRFEAGASAAFGGVQVDLIPEGERLSDAALESAFREESLHTSATTLLLVENTHNVAAGRVLGLDEMRRIARSGRGLGLKLHCDGARLWNAAVALGVKEADLVAGFDTVAVCFSKGLGAPAGSALCGPAALMGRARKLRKRFGGGMRQVGSLAAAALHALEHHRPLLQRDHDGAAHLARRLRSSPRCMDRGGDIEVRYPEPGTNMVYVRYGGGSAMDHCQRLADRGVRMIPMGDGWLRAVFHLDVPDRAADIAADALLSR